MHKNWIVEATFYFWVSIPILKWLSWLNACNFYVHNCENLKKFARITSMKSSVNTFNELRFNLVKRDGCMLSKCESSW